MTQVCDFSSPQNLTQLKNLGFAGIVRYVSDYAPKNITPGEYLQAKQLGLTVTLVCEQGAQPAMRGPAGGVHDGTIANSQADSVGYDPKATIYFVAEDPSELPQSSWATVEQYFVAVNQNSKRPVGAYGSLGLVTHLMTLGLATKGWVVQTWGGTSPQVHLEQLVGANTHGLAIDVDQVLQADYGQDPRPSGPVPDPPGGDMAVSPIVSFKPGQVDIFQISGGTLYHKWNIGTGWANEPIAGPSGGKSGQTVTLTGPPQVVVTPGQLVQITVEDTSGFVWVFGQSVTAAAWGANKLP